MSNEEKTIVPASILGPNDKDTNGASEKSTSWTGKEKPPRDLGDRNQSWVLLYEDRQGGYVGRIVGRPARGDGDTHDYYVLREFALFEEKRVQAFAIVPTPDRKGAQAQWAPAQTQRFIWPYTMTPIGPDEELMIAEDKIVHVIEFANTPPFIRQMWAEDFAQFDALCAEIRRQTAVGGGAPSLVVFGRANGQ